MINHSIQIRAATLVDAEQIAIVHTQSWQTTYKNIIAENYLNELNIQNKMAYWKRILSVKSDSIFVALSDAGIIDFCISRKKQRYK